MTFDPRTEKALATLDPKAAAKFRPFIQKVQALAESFGVQYLAIGGNRTWAEQDALYAQGRTKPGKIVTKAKGGQSNHNFGIALDFGVFKAGKYLDEKEPATANRIHATIAAIAAAHGLEAGHYWKFQDSPHYEVKTGLTLAQKRSRYQKSGSVFVS